MVTRDYVPEYIPTLTHKSREWARIFEARSEEAIRRLYPVALGEVLDDIVNIIEEELEYAVGNSNEYDRYQWMLQELKDTIAVPEVVVLDRNTGRIYLREGIENLGGDEGDFWDGVEAVRADLKEESESTKELSIAQEAAFWRNKVWPSDYYYSRTMAARRRYWGELTPWWIWLDSGNSDSTYAYPTSGATYFVDKAEGRANEVFELALEEMADRAENIVYEAVDLYISDPESFQPYDVLASFWEQGRPYEVYITETGRIGTRLGR
jgi:hypothetical protein